MATKSLFKYSLISGISTASFLLGSYIERNKCFQENSPEHGTKKMPALPIFGTVSAAAPFSAPDSLTPFNYLSTASQHVLDAMKFGYPSYDQLRVFDKFILSYDRRNRVAHWVFEHLTREEIQSEKKVDRALCDFKEDDKIHPLFRSTNADYKKSGYDRGHLAAAGNYKLLQKTVNDTFHLSNMAPQVGSGFNRDSWNRLERHVRKLTKVYSNIYCCTGPLYLPRKDKDGKNYVKYEVIGANHVAVPTHFFKILVGETDQGQLEMEAYVMPNEKIDDSVPLKSYQVPPESIERAAGLLFFDSLSRSKLKKINGKSN